MVDHRSRGIDGQRLSFKGTARWRSWSRPHDCDPGDYGLMTPAGLGSPTLWVAHKARRFLNGLRSGQSGLVTDHAQSRRQPSQRRRARELPGVPSRAPTFTPEQYRRRAEVAVHESGHAVMSVLLGGSIRKAVLAGNPRAQGATTHRREVDHDGALGEALAEGLYRAGTTCERKRRHPRRPPPS